MSDWDEPEAQFEAEHPDRRFSKTWWGWVMFVSGLAAIWPLTQVAQVSVMGGAAKYCAGYYTSVGTQSRYGYGVVPGVACFDGQPQYAAEWLIWVAAALFIVALAALMYRVITRRGTR